MLWLTLATSLFAASELQSDAKSCDVYLDLEKKFKCTRAGNYFIGYAYTYCEKFRNAKSHWDQALITWTEKTTKCLQDDILIAIKRGVVGCLPLLERGFSSHVACYTESGFCALREDQRRKVFDVIETSDLLSDISGSISQMLRVKMLCAIPTSEIVATIFHILFDLSREMDNPSKVYISEIYKAVPQNKMQAEEYVSDLMDILENGEKKKGLSKENHLKHVELNLKLLREDQSSHDIGALPTFEQQEQLLTSPNEEQRIARNVKKAWEILVNKR